MGQRSSIKELPEQILAQVNFMLAEGLTIDDVVDHLSQAGHPKSRSSVGRYKKNLDRVASKLRESREITTALVAELGDASAQGKQGRLLVEMARAVVFDLLVKLQDDSEELSAQDVANLGKGLAELGRALRFDQDFETKIVELAAKQAAEVVELIAEAEGLSRDTIEKFRSGVLGITKS